MTTVLRKFPFFETPTTALVRNDRLAIKPYQIIVWVSLAAGDFRADRPNLGWKTARWKRTPQHLLPARVVAARFQPA
jgi:hypothetical protein